MSTKHIILTILLTVTVHINISAQDNTQVGLPEGAIARLGKGGINLMRFSPDGTQLAVGTTIGTWLYDVDTGNVDALFPAERMRVNNQEVTRGQFEEWNVDTIDHVDTLAFSHDNRILASSGSSNSVIRLWELETGDELLYMPLHNDMDGVPGMTFSKDNKLLITPNQYSFILHWDITSGKLVAKHRGRSTDNEPLENGNYGDHRRDLIAFNQDNRTFVSGDPENGIIRLWDAVTGYQLAVFKAKYPFTISWKEWKPQKGVNALAFSHDGKTVASSHDDNTIRLWDTNTNTERVVLKGHSEKVDVLAFSNDSQILASGGADNRILLWDVRKGERLTALVGHKSSVSALVFSPTIDGLLASGSLDGTIRFWNTHTRQEQSIFTKGHMGGIKAVAFTTDNIKLASGVSNGTVEIWDIKTGRHLLSPSVPHFDNAEALAFSQDATLFAIHGADTRLRSIGNHIRTTSTPNKKIYLRMLPTGDELFSLPEEATSLAFSSDNTILAATTPEDILMFDTNLGNELFRLKSSLSIDTTITISPNGQYFGVNTTKPKIWDVSTQHEITLPEIDRVDTITFSPDSSLLALKHLKGIDLWNLTTEGIVKHTEIRPYKYSRDGLIVFSPDGKILLNQYSSSLEEKIELLEIKTGYKLGNLFGHTEPVETVVFSHDGKTLATGSQDGTILLWDWERIIEMYKR